MAYYKFKSARDCFAFYYKGTVDYPISKEALKVWKDIGPVERAQWRLSYKEKPFTENSNNMSFFSWNGEKKKQKPIVIINKDIV